MGNQNPGVGCQNINFIQTIPQTYEQRYNEYMQLSKEQLASMLAQRDITDMPDACTECIDNTKAASETYSASTVDFGGICAVNLGGSDKNTDIHCYISDCASTGITNNEDIDMYNYD